MLSSFKTNIKNVLLCMAQWRPACNSSRWESETGKKQKLEAREGYGSSSRPGTMSSEILSQKDRKETGTAKIFYFAVRVCGSQCREKWHRQRGGGVSHVL